MSNPLLLDILQYLTEAGIVEGDGIDSFRDILPETPDYCVALNEAQGLPQLNYEPMVHRSVQVSVRSKQADEARAKCLEIYKSLNSESKLVQFTDERWGQVHLRQPPFKLKQDANDRTVYCFNMGVTTTVD